MASVSLHDREYANHELRAMDEADARSTLTVDQFQRWEKLNTLHDEADRTRQEWADEDETVADLVVHADPEQLGTAVDLFGNDVLVRITPDDDEFRAVTETLNDEFGDDDDPDFDDVSDLDEATIERIGDALQEMLDLSLLRWNGADWRDLERHERDHVLHTMRDKWGVDGLLAAWLEIAAAVAVERDQQVSVIEKFRSPEWRGRR